MSQSIQRQRRNEKTFEDLPPGVVVYDILNYHEVRLDSSIREFDLFGYYRRDRRRSIWFLFQSLKFLQISNSDRNSFPIMKLEKLDFLQLNSQDLYSKDYFSEKRKRYISRMIEKFKRTNMYLLQSFSVNVFSSDSINFDGVFSSQNRFPKLKRLVIVSKRKYILKDWKWDVERIKSLQENLESLRVSLCLESFKHGGAVNISGFGIRLLGNDVTFSSLKIIAMSCIHFSNRRTIQLPLLESVLLADCRNLVIIPGSNVTSARLFNIQPDDLKELFLRSKRIYLLESFILFNNSNKWLWEESTNPMEHLTDLSIGFFAERSENFEIFLERIKSQLIRLNFYFSPSIQKDFLENGSLEKLEYLKLNKTDQLLLNETKWEFSNQLKELSFIRMSRIPSLRLNLFKTNKFSSLEVLEFNGCSYCYHKELNNSSISFQPLKNLKVLRVTNGYLGDIFFADHEIRNLEILDVCGPNMVNIYELPSSISGNRWKRRRYNKLREIRVVRDTVSNELFELIEFPVLRELELNNCHNISGEGWLELPSLCDFRMIDCTNFSKEKITEMKNKGVVVKKISFEKEMM